MLSRSFIGADAIPRRGQVARIVAVLDPVTRMLSWRCAALDLVASIISSRGLYFGRESRSNEVLVRRSDFGYVKVTPPPVFRDLAGGLMDPLVMTSS